MTPHRLPTAAAIAAPVVAGVTARTAAASSSRPSAQPVSAHPSPVGATSHLSESNSNPQRTCYGRDLTQVGFGLVLRTSRRPLSQMNGKWRVGHMGEPRKRSWLRLPHLDAHREMHSRMANVRPGVRAALQLK